MLDNEGMNSPVALKRTELFLFPLSGEKPHRSGFVAFYFFFISCTEEPGCLQLNKDGREREYKSTLNLYL